MHALVLDPPATRARIEAIEPGGFTLLSSTLSPQVMADLGEAMLSSTTLEYLSPDCRQRDFAPRPHKQDPTPDVEAILSGLGPLFEEAPIRTLVRIRRFNRYSLSSVSHTDNLYREKRLLIVAAGTGVFNTEGTPNRRTTRSEHPLGLGDMALLDNTTPPEDRTLHFASTCNDLTLLMLGWHQAPGEATSTLG